MTDKHSLKVPTDFSDPKEWRAYVRATVPTEDVDFTLAYGRTALFLRLYEVRGERFPEEFRAELTRIDGLSDPARTESLVALNDRILAAMTQFLASSAASSGGNETDTPRELIDNLARNNPCFALWIHYSKLVQQQPDAPCWQEYVANECKDGAESEIEFTLLMGDLGKLLAFFRDRNLALPPLYFERITFLHHLRGPERNLQARAVVQGLLEVIASCASA
ncbi:MAG TPA: hypothetical protein VGF01_07330 [Terracidiphilus sp.]